MKRICWVELTPLQVSSYTNLLYKVQDPFHACKQFKGPNRFLLFCNLEDQSLFHRSKTQEEYLLGGTNSFVGQFLHPSLVQNLRSIPHMQTVQGPKQISSLVQFGRPVFVSQIKKLMKRICCVEPTPLQVSSYTHLLYKVQHPSHACRQSVQGPKQTSFLLQFGRPVFVSRSRNLETKFDRWNEPVRRSVPAPFSCTKFTIHSTHVNSTRAQTKISSLVRFGRPVFVSKIKTSRRGFVGWNQLLCGSVLTPISFAKFKIHSTHADSSRA